MTLTPEQIQAAFTQAGYVDLMGQRRYAINWLDGDSTDEGGEAASTMADNLIETQNILARLLAEGQAVCEWTEDEEHVLYSGCGAQYDTQDWTLKEIIEDPEHKHCPKCGHRIEVNQPPAPQKEE